MRLGLLFGTYQTIKKPCLRFCQSLDLVIEHFVQNQLICPTADGFFVYVAKQKSNWWPKWMVVKKYADALPFIRITGAPGWYGSNSLDQVALSIGTKIQKKCKESGDYNKKSSDLDLLVVVSWRTSCSEKAKFLYNRWRNLEKNMGFCLSTRKIVHNGFYLQRNN